MSSAIRPNFGPNKPAGKATVTTPGTPRPAQDYRNTQPPVNHARTQPPGSRIGPGTNFTDNSLLKKCGTGILPVILLVTPHVDGRRRPFSPAGSRRHIRDQVFNRLLVLGHATQSATMVAIVGNSAVTLENEKEMKIHGC